MAFWRKAVRTIPVTRALTGSKYPGVSAAMKALCRQQRGSCGSERVPTNLHIHLYTRALSDVNSVSRHTALTGDTNYSPPLQPEHSIDVHGVCITSLPRVSQSYTVSPDGARHAPVRSAGLISSRCLLTATLAFNWHQQRWRTIC